MTLVPERPRKIRKCPTCGEAMQWLPLTDRFGRLYRWRAFCHAHGYAKRRVVDGDGVEVVAGCEIRFAFGLPPVGVLALVIERDGALIALTPDHNPRECKVSELRRHVGEFWVRQQK